MLVKSKAKKHKPDIEKLLLELTFDTEVVLYAISSLGKLKSKDSI